MNGKKQTKSEKLKVLRYAFNLARVQGLVKTQKEYADFIGISEDTLSGAMNGNERYLTDKLLFRVEKIMQENGINIYDGVRTMNANNTSGGIVNQGQVQKNFNAPNADPDDNLYRDLLAEMRESRIEKDKQIDRLLSIIENMQKQ